MWGTFTNGCVLCMEVVQSIGTSLDVEFRELRLQEMYKRSCMIDRGLGVLSQPPAQTCCSVQMALFMRIGASQFGNWPYSFQSAMVAMAIIDALGYSTVCARWVPRSLTTEHRRQRKAICSELLEHFDAEGEVFLSWIVTGDKTWAHHYKPDKKAVHGVASYATTKKKEVQDNSFCQKGYDHHLLGH